MVVVCGFHALCLFYVIVLVVFCFSGVLIRCVCVCYVIYFVFDCYYLCYSLFSCVYLESCGACLHLSCVFDV